VVVLDSVQGHEFVATAGKPRPKPLARFPIASVTKTFTATIVLQLVQEQKLSLDGTLNDYLPGVVPDGNQITLTDLLQNRSGLPDFVTLVSPPVPASPIGVLGWAGSQPLDFTPGTKWEYSNTNYLALGLIIEKVTGQTYAQELSTRILQPLGLTATSLPSGDRPEGSSGDWWMAPNILWSAAGIISDVHDLARFYSALLSGSLLSPPLLAQMQQTVSDQQGVVPSGGHDAGDGLGIVATDFPCGRFWGHVGEVPNYDTLVEANPTSQRVLVVFVKSYFEWAPGNVTPLLCPSTGR
jgi:D-alanyl-D-alanine carboxypeptidase